LALQGDGRGGHHDGLARGDRAGDGGHEVGQRLPGAGTRLDRQVLAGLECLRNSLGHLDLAGPFRAAQPRDRGGE
jgi:hypothetical protein